MDSNGDFITVKPSDNIIAKYIAYYYFHSSDDSGFQKKFFFYPNYKHALTVYRNSDVALKSEGSIVRPSKSNKMITLYSVNTSRNVSVNLNGRFDKIGVVFNPLGLNHFVEPPLSEIFQNSFLFEYFGEPFHDFLQAVFSEKDAVRRAEMLDAFFLDKLRMFDEPILKKSVQRILKTNGAVKVEELSSEFNVSRKTLLRLFKKHLCCSVEEYKKLVMFRNALNYSQQKDGLLSLTDVALYNLYYDQAHFINQFKSITKLSPKTLLSKITRLDHELYWNFDE